jgi:hypothetical protein
MSAICCESSVIKLLVTVDPSSDLFPLSVGRIQKEIKEGSAHPKVKTVR